jgi:hypothetical protein
VAGSLKTINNPTIVMGTLVYSTAEVDALLAALTASIPSGGSSSGSPEGVTTAPVGSTRWDEATGILWLKRTGTGNTGWFAYSTL